MFGQYGPVTKINLKGWHALITYANSNAARYAQQNLNNMPLNGQNLSVEFSQPKHEREKPKEKAKDYQQFKQFSQNQAWQQMQSQHQLQ